MVINVSEKLPWKTKGNWVMSSDFIAINTRVKFDILTLVIVVTSNINDNKELYIWKAL